MSTIASALWLRLPLAASRISRGLTIVLADGWYLTRWPALAVAAPAAALAVGAAVSITRAPYQLTYTYSLPGMIAVVAVAGFGAALGLYAVLAYAVCDFFLYPHNDGSFGLRPALLGSYLLLGALAVLAPLSARLIARMTLPVRWRQALPGQLLEVVLTAAIAGILVFLWTESAAFLIRPIFTWTEQGTPSDPAIEPLQQTGWILAVVAAGVAAARTALEHHADPRTALAFVQGLGRHRAWRPPMPVAVVAEGAFVTFLLAGLLESWPEAAVVLIALIAIAVVRRGLPGMVPAWASLMSRVPVLVRLAVGMVATVLVGRTIIERVFYSTQDLWPVTASALAGVLLMSVLLPAAPAGTARS